MKKQHTKNEAAKQQPSGGRGRPVTPHQPQAAATVSPSPNQQRRSTNAFSSEPLADQQPQRKRRFNNNNNHSNKLNIQQHLQQQQQLYFQQRFPNHQVVTTTNAPMAASATQMQQDEEEEEAPQQLQEMCKHVNTLTGCKYGPQKCKYRHPTRLCSYFYNKQTNGCRQGSNCRYLHDHRPTVTVASSSSTSTSSTSGGFYAHSNNVVQQVPFPMTRPHKRYHFKLTPIKIELEKQDVNVYISKVDPESYLFHIYFDKLQSFNEGKILKQKQWQQQRRREPVLLHSGQWNSAAQFGTGNAAKVLLLVLLLLFFFFERNLIVVFLSLTKKT